MGERRMKKTLCTVLVVLCLLSTSALTLITLPVRADEGDNILVITYNYKWETYPETHNVEKALVETGYPVTALYNPEPCVIASTLAANDYNQIYLFDITFTILGLTDPGDKTALASWYSNHRGNIVIDGRSYGIYYEYDKDKKLIENIAHAFSLKSGGLWIGVGYEGWTENGNALLSEIGYGTVTGRNYSAITGGDTASELLSVPNSIMPSTLWAEVAGSPPSGMQSDGVDLTPLLWSGDIVYTSYALQSMVAIPATIDINPDTLNLESKGRWITAYIELPEGYSVDDIDVSSITLNGVISAEQSPSEVGDYDADGAADLMVKFDRQDLIAILSEGEETLAITGRVNEASFEGCDTIRVIGR